ncbi:MAG: PIN domain-containing protein [Gammaproteobacteria bacterium]|nr:MAG: PIN domain-containing protein [Gammaproteobacteria bacterium]
MADYLLDTNQLIYLSSQEDSANKKEALEKIRAVLQDDSSRLFVTPLIAYEFLRKPAWGNNKEYERLKTVTQQFEMLDITSEIAEVASKLYRFDVHNSQQKNGNKNFDKRNFDTFHFATAKVNGLHVLSKDKHMRALETLYQKMKE